MLTRAAFATTSFALAAFFAPAVAFAETASPAAAAPTPEPGAAAPTKPAASYPSTNKTPDRDSPRLRFGVGGAITFGLAQGPYVSAGAFNPGVWMDIGVQLNDRTAIYLRGEAGSILFANQAALYGIAEWTPESWISFGTGFGADAMAIVSFGGSSNNTWAGWSIPLLLSFNFGKRPPELARRSMFRLGLEGAVGRQSTTGVIGWHTAINLGFEIM